MKFRQKKEERNQLRKFKQNAELKNFSSVKKTNLFLNKGMVEIKAIGSEF